MTKAAKEGNTELLRQLLSSREEVDVNFADEVRKFDCLCIDVSYGKCGHCVGFFVEMLLHFFLYRIV